MISILNELKQKQKNNPYFVRNSAPVFGKLYKGAVSS